MNRINKQALRLYCKWLTGAFLVFQVLSLLLLRVNGLSYTESLLTIPQLLGQTLPQPLFWLFLSLPYLTFRLIRYFYRLYWNRGMLFFFQTLFGLCTVAGSAGYFSFFLVGMVPAFGGF